MKTKSFSLLFLAAALCAANATTLIYIPMATNSPAYTNAPYWVTSPPPASIVGWQQTQVLNTNFHMIETALNSLKLPFGTVTNQTNSTGGVGAGLVKADTNYIYVS